VRALARLMVAVALVGLVVGPVTDEIARANISVCGLRVGYDRQCGWKAMSLARAGIPACGVEAASAR
jgi:hypothetical protein